VFPYVLVWYWLPQNQILTRAWIHVVYLGSDPRKTNEEVGEVRQGGKKSQKGYVNESYLCR
jgi:hypothetical protein